MRLKSELYKKEQDDIVNNIIHILDLEHKNTYTLYELDHNNEIQQRIMELIPEIRKWFSFNGIKAVGDPQKIKRPYLSIIKHLLKNKYNILTNEVRIIIDNKEIRTTEYIFIQI
jgi:hypothetical protein